MTASGDGILNAVLYAALLALCLPLGLAASRGRDRPRTTFLTRREAIGALAIWLVVAIPSLAQAMDPALLPALWRDPQRVLGQGEAWRALTSGVVQDGGTAGTLFNLAILAVVAPVGVRAWGIGRAVLILVVAQLVFGVAATVLVPQPGAGNSAATFALATSLAGRALVAVPDPGVRARAAGVAVISVACLVLGDAHGIAMLTGLALGVGLSIQRPA